MSVHEKQIGIYKTRLCSTPRPHTSTQQHSQQKAKNTVDVSINNNSGPVTHDASTIQLGLLPLPQQQQANEKGDCDELSNNRHQW